MESPWNDYEKRTPEQIERDRIEYLENKAISEGAYKFIEENGAELKDQIFSKLMDGITLQIARRIQDDTVKMFFDSKMREVVADNNVKSQEILDKFKQQIEYELLSVFRHSLEDYVIRRIELTLEQYKK